jgi:hypothetical protein
MDLPPGVDSWWIYGRSYYGRVIYESLVPARFSRPWSMPVLSKSVETTHPHSQDRSSPRLRLFPFFPLTLFSILILLTSH